MNLKSTKEVREKAYKSLVRPQVEYAASVWYPWLARDKARIERVQRRAARYVYNTYSRYSSVTAMLQSLNWETLESHRFNMHLCIIYKVFYNLAMFPLLDYATPITVQTWGNNIKFILPHCSKDVFKHSFLPAALRGWNPPSHQWRLHPWNCSRPASQVLHTNAAPNCFYPALSGCFVVKCTFSLLFFFSAHHVSSSVLTARD